MAGSGAGLRPKVSASPAGVELAWDAVSGDDTLYDYDALRSGTAGGPYTKVGSVLSGTTSFFDAEVIEGAPLLMR